MGQGNTNLVIQHTLTVSGSVGSKKLNVFGVWLGYYSLTLCLVPTEKRNMSHTLMQDILFYREHLNQLDLSCH